MSGILGIWNLDGGPIDRVLLARLASAQAHRNRDGERVWIEDNIGLLFQSLWVTPESVGQLQPVVREGESIVLFDGRLDNREELLSLFGQCDSRRSDANFVAAAYGKFGDAFVERLLGDFAVVVYDVREKKLLLARDGIGVRPLYYATLGSAFVTATECKAILNHPKAKAEPNLDMIAAYFLAAFGREQEGWTFFRDINAVIPGQIITVRRGSLVKRTYWDFGEPAPLRFGTFEAYAEAFRHHFDRALARRLRTAYPVTVSVSGGLDSSSIFCAGHELLQRGQVDCPALNGLYVDNTGPIPNSAPLLDEQRFVDDIQNKYAVTIQRLSRDPSRFIAGSPTTGFRVIEMPYMRGPMDFSFPLENETHRLGSRVLLTGTFADQLVSNRGYLIDVFRRGSWRQVWSHVRTHSEYFPTAGYSWFTKSFFSELLRYYIPRQWRPRLRTLRRGLSGDRIWFSPSLRARIERVEALQAFRPPGRTAHQQKLYEAVRPMYYLQGIERCERVGALCQIECSYPFLDRELLSFLMAVPGEFICHNGVPKAILRAAMVGTLPDSIVNRRWKAEGTQEFGRAVDRSLPVYVPLLRPPGMAVSLGLVDSESLHPAIERLQRRIHDDGCRSARNISDLVGLELWLRAFFGEQHNGPSASRTSNAKWEELRHATP